MALLSNSGPEVLMVIPFEIIDLKFLAPGMPDTELIRCLKTFDAFPPIERYYFGFRVLRLRD